MQTTNASLRCALRAFLSDPIMALEGPKMHLKVSKWPWECQQWLQQVPPGSNWVSPDLGASQDTSPARAQFTHLQPDQRTFSLLGPRRHFHHVPLIARQILIAQCDASEKLGLVNL